MSHRETNPHFSRPLRPQYEDHQRPPTSPVPPVQPQQPHGHGQPPLGGGARTRREDQPRQPSRPKVKILEPPLRPLGSPPVPPLAPPPVHQEAPHKPIGSPLVPPPMHQRDHHFETRQPHRDPHRQPRHEHRGHLHGPRMPARQKTKAYTWFAAVFCVLFWLIIIIGGLIVLIVYLVFRPQSPYFDVSGVTLNAAYLDFGYLLNADVTMLANFTNPNKKVHVDFSSVIIYMYYGSTLIASQYVEPFSAAKVESMFASIHMITSQVQLPLRESERLMKQMESNGILFEVRGVFRARSKLGRILRYSYNLYGLCNIMVTRPPDGILVKKKCRTKR